MNKKKKFLYVLGSLLLVLGLFGITYGWFSYRTTTGDQRLIAGDIYLRLNEGEEEISLTNIFPETEEEARSRNDNYITFNVEGVNESDKDIYYEIVLVHGNDKSSPYVRFNDGDLRFDLLEIDANGDEITSILSNVSFDSLVNQRIYVDTVDGGTSSNVSKRYMLRMWLGDNVTISDSDTNASYAATGYNNHYANIKVVVSGDFIEKTAPFQAYNEIKKLASTKNYIGNYDTIIEQNLASGFTTHDQVSDNATKKTVYYYTGNEAAANSNVLFAGYCWQVVRTTDNGGVRMIYNGVAQKAVTASTPISNTDITYTNDGTYPYTYDTDTKKWTSANAGVASSTDSFIFTVNTAGDYAINYIVSSQELYDIAKFYKNNVLIGEHSGTEESIIDLGTLTTTDEMKIEYTKDSSNNKGNDNIIFSIESVTTRSENPVCTKGRTVTKGINAIGNGRQSMSAASLYGRSFDYNLSTGEFTIEDSIGLPSTWSTGDNNSNGIPDYKELIGTYTCLSNSTTCTTLYYVGSINQSNTAEAYVSKYTIGDVAHYSQMGTSVFNSNYKGLAMVGYMFNTEYDFKTGSKSGEYFTTATWNGITYILSNGNSGTSPDETHHYICDTDCTKIRYYYYSTSYYILLENGMTVEDAIYQMTGNGTPETEVKTINANYELNNYNSAIKGYLDNWYKKNLTGYTSYLDNTSVYCNDRSIRDLASWNPSGTSLTGPLQFKQYNSNRDLNCVNETDRFAVTNNKAELTYPIGLLTEPERILMTDNFAKTGQYYWVGSPYYFHINTAYVRYVRISGVADHNDVNHGNGARGVITLKQSALFESGDGTYTNPYIVGPIVDRNS